MPQLKIAISGKGGVGKTTIASTIGRLYGRAGKHVVLVDCDPSPNLALSLGISEEQRKNIIPLSQMSELIAERTGIAPGSGQGKMYTLNPKVDDLLTKFGVQGKNNVTLMVLGTIRSGGSGCFCPESALLRRMLSHLVRKDDVLIMDMEAGVEHLGRGTTKNIDLLLVVVEPTLRSLETAGRIKKLAEDIGIEKIVAILNKSRSGEDEELIGHRLGEMGIEMLGAVPFSDKITDGELKGISVLDMGDNQDFIDAVKSIIDRLP